MRASAWAVAMSAVMAMMLAAAAQAAPKVTATIAPIHSLAARVMAGVAEPRLLIQPGASPHHYAMRPSEAAALAEADVVFWVGPELELWLEGPIKTLASHAAAPALAEAEGVTLLPLREGGAWERLAEAAGGHAHAAHGLEQGLAGHLHDPHLWLDPENAKAMMAAMAEILAEVDPENADRYRSNAEAGRAEIDALSAELRDALAPYRETPFIVFHDAYHYFDRRFELASVGAIAMSDADAPGPARVQEIRKQLETSGAACVFTEPQFTPKLAEAVVDGSKARIGALDPLGVGLEPGAALYPTLIRNLGAALIACLAGS